MQEPKETSERFNPAKDFETATEIPKYNLEENIHELSATRKDPS